MNADIKKLKEATKELFFENGDLLFIAIFMGGLGGLYINQFTLAILFMVYFLVRNSCLEYQLTKRMNDKDKEPSAA